jgi:outer membrane protein OmpA-like peptidoglycan-associated protein
MRLFILFIFISFGSFAQSSVSLIVGGTDRTLQQASTRRDVMLHYTTLGLQFGRLMKPEAEVFGGVNFGFDPSSPPRSASASAGMRYYLKPLTKRLIPFGQFSGELLFDNSFALTNRDADFIGSAGMGIDFKAASTISIRGSVVLGLPFFSTGTLSPLTNSGSNLFTGLSLVFHLQKTKTVSPHESQAEIEAVLNRISTSQVEQAGTKSIQVIDSVSLFKQKTDSLISAPIIVVENKVDSTKALALDINLDAKERVSNIQSLSDAALDSLFNTQIYFKTDKSWVGLKSAKKLDRVVELMKKYPEVKIHLKGYTDYRNTVEYNSKLSFKRVKNVYLYLIKHGVPPFRFKTESLSENDPISSKNLQLNRRVEVRIWR